MRGTQPSAAAPEEVRALGGCCAGEHAVVGRAWELGAAPKGSLEQTTRIADPSVWVRLLMLLLLFPPLVRSHLCIACRNMQLSLQTRE